MTKIWLTGTILIKDDENGQWIPYGLRVRNIWPRDTILIKGDENMAKRYYPH